MSKRGHLLGVLAAIALAVGGAGSAGAFEIGIFEPGLGAADTGTRIRMITRSGGEVLRVNINWAGLALRRPKAARNPRDPAYHWQPTDRAVHAAQRAGLRVLISFQTAPRWAEGPHRPAAAAAGSWEPRPGAVADFATALARRYPAVHQFQVWNEPNLPVFLSPQYVKRHRTFRPFAAAYYRRMLNAAYAAVTRVSRRNRVFAAGTAPYGEPAPGGPTPFRSYGDIAAGGARTQPAPFWRQLLCLRGDLSRGACPNPAHFDVLDHHPYPIAGPRNNARNRGDIAIPDMHVLGSILAAARRQGTVLPPGPKALAVTEVSWDSRPPDPDGVPAQRHAAWLADMLYVLWKQHVRTVLWFRVVDQPPIPSFAFTNQSGLYLLSGRPKPAQRAFAFPFACEHRRSPRYRIWGMAPRRSPRVTVQMQVGSGWKTVARPRPGADRVFTAKLSGSVKRLRAVQGARTSLTCSLNAKGK